MHDVAMIIHPAGGTTKQQAQLQLTSKSFIQVLIQAHLH